MATDTDTSAGGIVGGVFPLLNGHIVIMQEFTVQFREWSTDMIERSLFSDKHTLIDEAVAAQTTTRSGETMDD